MPRSPAITSTRKKKHKNSGRQNVVSVRDYDPQDMALIKAMVSLYTNIIAEYPQQSSELIRKSVAPNLKEQDFEDILSSAFIGVEVPEGIKAEIKADLIEINKYANYKLSDLRLKSKIKYQYSDIAMMVRLSVLESVTDQQRNKSVNEDAATQTEKIKSRKSRFIHSFFSLIVPCGKRNPQREQQLVIGPRQKN